MTWPGLAGARGKGPWLSRFCWSFVSDVLYIVQHLSPLQRLLVRLNCLEMRCKGTEGIGGEVRDEVSKGRD